MTETWQPGPELDMLVHETLFPRDLVEWRWGDDYGENQSGMVATLEDLGKTDELDKVAQMFGNTKRPYYMQSGRWLPIPRYSTLFDVWKRVLSERTDLAFQVNFSTVCATSIERYAVALAELVVPSKNLARDGYFHYSGGVYTGEEKIAIGPAVLPLAMARAVSKWSVALAEGKTE